MVLFSILIQDEKDFDFDKEVFRHYKRMIGMVRNSNFKLVIHYSVKKPSDEPGGRIIGPESYFESAYSNNLDPNCKLTRDHKISDYEENCSFAPFSNC